MLAGQRFDRYEIDVELGAGGMGRVYRAFDTKLQRRVALKVLSGIFSEEADREQAVQGLLREARLAASLDHPNIVSVFDVGEVDGVAFVAMELVRGKSLRAFVGDSSISIEQRVAWLADVARALDAAHRRGLVHRDVKPENVMIRDDGIVKVLDFGIARRAKVAMPDAATLPASDNASGALDTGVAGTPMYMAPEQIRGEALDGRCDQFAWGILAYELLSGSTPWGGGDLFRVIGSVLSNEAPPLARACSTVPARVADAADRTLRKAPADRFTSMRDVLAALSASERPPKDVAHATTLLDTPRVRAPEASTISASAMPERPKKRRKLGLILMLPVALVAAASLFIWRSHVNAIVVAAAPTTTTPPAASSGEMPFAMEDLEIAEHPKPEAERLYREGLRAMFAGRFSESTSALLQATQIEPSFAAAELQLAAIAYFSFSPARDHLLRAIELRDHLSARDKAFSTGLQPCVLPERADYVACARNLGAASAAFPRDAQILLWLAITIGLSGDEARSVALLADVLKLAPGATYALSMKAQNEAYLGRFVDSARDLAACREADPASTTSLDFSLWVNDQQGDPEHFDADARARRLLPHPPTKPYFPDALFVAGSPRVAVLSAWDAWKKDAAKSWDWTTRWGEAMFDVLDGDFVSSVTKLASIEPEVITSGYPWRWLRVPAPLLETLNERGDDKTAAREATALRDRLPSLPPNTSVEDWGIAQDPLPRLLRAQLLGGAITREQYTAAREAWVKDWQKRTSPFFMRYVWLHGYAAQAYTPDEAKEALAALPSFGDAPPFRPLTATNLDLGRMYLLAGQRDKALDYLKRAAHSSAAIEYPIAFVRAHLWYGIALAEEGDKNEACAEFGKVVERWGKAKPRSLTAEEALRRAKALGCR